LTGIFTLSGGSWHAAAPSLTSPAASGVTNVLGLTTTDGRTTAILTVGSGRAAFVVAAWSHDGGAHWAQSAALSSPVLAAGGQPSLSFAADGTAGLVVTPAATRGTASQVATIGWQARAWDTLPALPPLSGTTTSTRVATVVAAADGSEPVGSGVSPGQTVSPRGAAASGAPQALEVDGGTMTVWQLDTRGWTLAQTVRVPVPYGSSG
jgi:hypothetical protein